MKKSFKAHCVIKQISPASAPTVRILNNFGVSNTNVYPSIMSSRQNYILFPEDKFKYYFRLLQDYVDDLFLCVPNKMPCVFCIFP